MAVFFQTLRNAPYMELVEACKRHVIGPEYMKTTLLLSKKVYSVCFIFAQLEYPTPPLIKKRGEQIIFICSSDNKYG